MSESKNGTKENNGSNADSNDFRESSADRSPSADGGSSTTQAGGDPAAESQAEAEKWKNEYLYLRAEYENFKKQVIKERSDLRKYGAERLVADLLGVLDIFETALHSEVNSDNVANFRKGIDMTANELRNVLGRHGITEIASQGQPFDPAFHEALSSEESTEFAPGTVTRVFKKPYRLHDRVVRPGQVVVAKSKG